MLNSTHASAARARAVEAINRSLRKYERLVAPPRHLQIPVAGCSLQSLERLYLRAAEQGNHKAAARLNHTFGLEYARVTALAKWANGESTRSERCWAAMAGRLRIQLEYAELIGAVSGDSLRFVHDRIRDCAARAARLRVERSTN